MKRKPSTRRRRVGEGKLERLNIESEIRLLRLKLPKGTSKKVELKRERKEKKVIKEKLKKRKISKAAEAYYKEIDAVLMKHNSVLKAAPIKGNYATEKIKKTLEIVRQRNRRLKEKLAALPKGTKKVTPVKEPEPVKKEFRMEDILLNKRAKATPSLARQEVIDRVESGVKGRELLNAGVEQLFNKRDSVINSTFNALKETAYVELVLALTCCPWTFGQYVTYKEPDLLLDGGVYAAIVHCIEFTPVSPYYKVTLYMKDKGTFEVELSAICGAVRKQDSVPLSNIETFWKQGIISLGTSLSRYLALPDLLRAMSDAGRYSTANMLTPETQALLKLLQSK